MEKPKRKKRKYSYKTFNRFHKYSHFIFTSETGLEKYQGIPIFISDTCLVIEGVYFIYKMDSKDLVTVWRFSRNGTSDPKMIRFIIYLDEQQTKLNRRIKLKEAKQRKKYQQILKWLRKYTHYKLRCFHKETGFAIYVNLVEAFLIGSDYKVYDIDTDKLYGAKFFKIDKKYYLDKLIHDDTFALTVFLLYRAFNVNVFWNITDKPEWSGEKFSQSYYEISRNTNSHLFSLVSSVHVKIIKRLEKKYGESIITKIIIQNKNSHNISLQTIEKFIKRGK